MVGYCYEYLPLIFVLYLVSRSTFLYLKFLLVWALVLLADFVLEFRFEYLWPFWLFIRSVYDSFRYQGLVSGIFLSKDFTICSYVIFTDVGIKHRCRYIWRCGVSPLPSRRWVFSNNSTACSILFVLYHSNFPKNLFIFELKMATHIYMHTCICVCVCILYIFKSVYSYV